MSCVDEVARTKIEDHETRCDERHRNVNARFGRIENILWSVAGCAIITLVQVIFKVF